MMAALRDLEGMKMEPDEGPDWRQQEESEHEQFEATEQSE